jgi:hypothetical protein
VGKNANAVKKRSTYRVSDAADWVTGEMRTDNPSSHIKPKCNAGALTGAEFYPEA